MPSLTLGPITFTDFELPARIVFGGRQRLAVHQLPGGARVIDAIGRDDAPLSWSGIFTGPDATARARTLDLMRTEGQAWAALWDDFSYTVIVAEFAARYERTNWIPYRISCTVLTDNTFVPTEAAPSLLLGLLADLGAATALSGFGLGSVTAAVNAPTALVLGSTANANATAAIAAATAAIAEGLDASGVTLGSTADFPVLASAAQQSAQFAAARSYVLRAQANLANSGG